MIIKSVSKENITLFPFHLNLGIRFSGCFESTRLRLNATYGSVLYFILRGFFPRVIKHQHFIWFALRGRLDWPAVLCARVPPRTPRLDYWSSQYTLFQNGRHFSILLFPRKFALMTSLSNVKFKRIFNFERSHKGQFAWKQMITKMAAILE